jgi:putative membrane protein insertion efficiency factor
MSPKSVAVALVRFYQRAISPFLPAACRFYPSCSEYARQAIDGHGLGRGSWLAVVRLSRCHPFSRGGFDAVPPAAGVRSTHGTSAG